MFVLGAGDFGAVGKAHRDLLQRYAGFLGLAQCAQRPAQFRQGLRRQGALRRGAEAGEKGARGLAGIALAIERFAQPQVGFGS